MMLPVHGSSIQLFSSVRLASIRGCHGGDLRGYSRLWRVERKRNFCVGFGTAKSSVQYYIPKAPALGHIDSWLQIIMMANSGVDIRIDTYG